MYGARDGRNPPFRQPLDRPAMAAHGDAADGRGSLQPYLPRLTLEWLANDPSALHRAVDGSVVFVDISGFTKLSEKLAKLGRVGAEEMADAINTCFADLLGVAYARTACC